MTETVKRASAQMRIVEFDLASRSAADGDGIPVVISTDAVVETRDGPEILVHASDAIDLSRAPLPIIATHRDGQVNVGIVDGLVPNGSLLRGMARFGARPEAAGYRDDVLRGIIRSVSVGYTRIKGRMRMDGVLVTERWMPSHVAMVAEPADPGAGFYRSLEREPIDFVVEVEEGSESVTTSETAVRTVVTTTAKSATKGTAMSDEVTAAAGASAEVSTVNDGTTVERLRIRGITDLCRQHKVDDKTRDEWVDKGVTLDVAATRVLDILAERGKSAPQSVAQLGLTKAEVGKYSLNKAIRAVLDKSWTNAGLELEAHRAIAQRLGRTNLNEFTFFVPLEVQRREMATQAQRDMTVGTANAGGYLVETQNQGFIDLLRARSVVMNMGARRLSGLVGNLTIPKQTAAGTGYWLSTEASQITESQPTLGQLALSPKTVGGYTEISRQLTLQSSPDAEQLVMSDLAQVIALAVDTAALNGSGSSGQPTGILGTSGIGSVTGTSIAVAGVIEFQSDVAGANALNAACGYATTPAVAGLLMQRQRFSSTDTPLWEGNMLEGKVFGFRSMSSNQMPSATMIFGDWSQVVIGEWGVLELEVNPYADFKAGIVGVRAMYSIDVGVRIPAAFSAATSIT